MPDNIIKNLKDNDLCWDFFNVQREIVLKSIKDIRETLEIINQKGCSLVALVRIWNFVEEIEHQMPEKRK